MKSKFLYVVSIFLVVMASIFMYGCNEQPKYYDVSVNVWYPNYGTAYGNGTFEENTTCTISATEKTNSTFLAWMHNNVIVSYESTWDIHSNFLITRYESCHPYINIAKQSNDIFCYYHYHKHVGFHW